MYSQRGTLVPSEATHRVCEAVSHTGTWGSLIRSDWPAVFGVHQSLIPSTGITDSTVPVFSCMYW